MATDGEERQTGSVELVVSSTSYVYFVCAGEGRPIKIGVSSDPAARLADLQVAHWEQLQFLSVVDERIVGGEHAAHLRFQHLHMRGEWFRPDAELLTYIGELRDRDVSAAFATPAKAPAGTVAVAPVRMVRADVNPAAVYLAHLDPGESKRSQTSALRTVAAMIAGRAVGIGDIRWAELRYQHTQAIRAILASSKAPATANRILAAVMGTLKEAWRLGQMTAEDYQRAVDIKRVRYHRLPAGKEIGSADVAAMLADCAADSSPRGRRDECLISLLYLAGLRREEVGKLQLSDLQDGSLRIVGKGRKERRIYLSEDANCSVRRWLDVRGEEPGALILGLHPRSGGSTRRGVSPGAVYSVVKTRAERACVTPPSPHDFRRTYAGNLLDAGVDIVTVQRLMGHANPATTSRYDRRGDEPAKRAAAMLRLPPKKAG